MDAIKTHIATSNATSITVRGRDLVHDLMGRHSFTDMIYFLLRGRMPTASQTRVLDACLVTLMEHGWTPTSIIARLAIDSVPGQAQVGIAAGFAQESGCDGRYISLLQQLSAELDRAMGRHLTINATGAIAALLLEIDLPPQVMRSIATISRAAGLAGHLAEEHETHAGRRIWQLVEEHIPYEKPQS
jgi:citrate synthase